MKNLLIFLLLPLLVYANLFGCNNSDTGVSTESTSTQNEMAATPETPEQQTTTNSVDQEQPSVTKKSLERPEEGWKKIEGAGMSLIMPDSFDGGIPSEDMKLIVDKIREISPNFENIAAMIEQNPTMFKLMAFDSEVGDAGFLTNINVVQEIIPAVLTLDDYLAAMRKQLPPEFKVIKEERMEINSYPTAHLIVELDMAGTLVKEAIYIVKTDDIVWVMTCATSMAEFDGRAATFERIANSFSLDS